MKGSCQLDHCIPGLCASLPSWETKTTIKRTGSRIPHVSEKETEAWKGGGEGPGVQSWQDSQAPDPVLREGAEGLPAPLLGLPGLPHMFSWSLV